MSKLASTSTSALPRRKRSRCATFSCQSVPLCMSGLDHKASCFVVAKCGIAAAEGGRLCQASESASSLLAGRIAGAKARMQAAARCEWSLHVTFCSLCGSTLKVTELVQQRQDGLAF